MEEIGKLIALLMKLFNIFLPYFSDDDDELAFGIKTGPSVIEAV